MAGTHARRVDRPSPWPWLVPVAALVAGALFASSVRASGGEDLRADSARLPDLIREQTRVNAERAGEVDDLRTKVEEATARLVPVTCRPSSSSAKAAQIAAAAGRTPVEGPALRVSLNDAKLVGGEVPEGADPDDYVIHQQDVQAVVNALWDGGAEAMMIQDQRIISTSAVRCVGNTLILQGRVYSPPYVVTAIGDRDAMRRSLDADDDVGLLRECVGGRRPRLRRREHRQERFPAYSGSITPSTPRSPARDPTRARGWCGEVLITPRPPRPALRRWQVWWTDVDADRQQDQIVQALTDDFLSGSVAELMRLKSTVAVAGTHGKTTTTSMIACLLDAGGVDPTVINGGIIEQYGSNAQLGDSDWMVVESDESDGSFLRLDGTIAVVTNIDPEHLDHYGDFDGVKRAFVEFIDNVPFYGAAVLCVDHPEVQAVIGLYAIARS